MENIIARITELLEIREYIIVAIDGRCASGKTTLAEKIREKTGCLVIHMDDFFLTPEMRTPERLNTPGENIDHERFLSEVLIPLSKNQPFSYRPYLCHEARYGDEVRVTPSRLTVVEGSYSLNVHLRDYYDLKVFCDTDAGTQRRRILTRNGKEGLLRFEKIWIPLEEKYFSTGIRDICDTEVKK